MSYRNRKERNGINGYYNYSETEDLNLFVNSVKKEIDGFWTNILDEFDTFSNDIKNTLGKIEKDYNEYRQKYGLLDNNEIEHRYNLNNNHHRSSYKHEETENENENENKTNNNNIKNNKNTESNLNSESSHSDSEMFENDEHRQAVEQYKKFIKNGNNASIAHKRSLSTMEIPASFKLDPLSYTNVKL